MKKIYSGIIVLLFGFILGGCSKDMDDELSFLGEWTEKSPVQGRTDLLFVSTDRAVLSKAGEKVQELRFKVEGDSIYLSPEGELFEESAEALFFKQIDESSLQLENIYAPDTLEEMTYMIFERIP